MLLCPISPVWFTLSAAALLGVSLLPFAVAYRLLWNRRYQRYPANLPADSIRLRGTVVEVEGPDQACEHCRRLAFERRANRPPVSRIFSLRDKRRLYRIDPSRAFMIGGPPSISQGDRVTLDVLRASLPHPGEHLFRQQATDEGFTAVRLIRGCWPELRGLTRGLFCATVVCWAILILFGYR